MRRIGEVVIICVAVVLYPAFVSSSVAFANEISERADLHKIVASREAIALTGSAMEPISTKAEVETTGEVVRGETAGSDKAEIKEKEYLDDEESSDEEEFEEEVVESIPDPLKPFNRLMFQFNDKLYFYVLKPVARAYKAILPEPVRLSVRNVISNLTTPIRLVNCILQGKIDGAGIEFSRFMVNTTTGVFGLFDVAKIYHRLGKQDEDFGQTLGHYGLKEGLYIVWPVFGPSTIRDTIGMAGDYFFNPLLYINPTSELIGIDVNKDTPTLVNAANKINETSRTLGTYEEFKESSIDPYISMRNAYFENRRNKIKQ